MLLHAVELLEVLGILLCVNYLYGKKYRFRFHDVIFVLSGVMILTIVNAGKESGELAFLYYIVMFIYMLLKFEGHIKTAFINEILCIILMSLFQLIGALPVFAPDLPVSADVKAGMVNLLVLGFVLLPGKAGYLHRLSLFARRSSWLFRGILICCCAGMIYLVVMYRLTHYLRATDYLIFGLWTLLICVLAIKWQKAKSENIMSRHEMEMRRTYDKVYGELLESIRRKQHDFNNHINAIYSQHLVAQDMEDLVRRQREYCQLVVKDSQYSRLLVKGAPFVVGFLYFKFTTAEQRGCEITYRVENSELKCRIPAYKVVEMLGILLDNAVEAVQNMEKKEIEFEMLENEKQIHILVSNISVHIPQSQIYRLTEAGYSTKGEGRGIGLANLIDTLRSYDCDLLVFNRQTKSGNHLAFEMNIPKT